MARQVSVVEKIDGNKIHIHQTTFHTAKEVIDGHFWIEKPNGEVYNDFTGKKIIDKWLSYQENWGEIPIYLPAEKADEERYIKQRLANTELEFRKCGGKEIYFNSLSNLELHDRDCYFNTILTNFKTGFKIRYGHFGMMKPNGMIYWIFGHPRNTFDDFEVNGEKNDSPKNEGETHYSTHPYLVSKIEEKKKKRLELERLELEKRMDFEKKELEKKKKIAEQNERELLAMLEKEDKQKSKKQKSKKSVKKH